MKRIVFVLIALLLLVGCSKKEAAPQIQPDARLEATQSPQAETAAPALTAAPVTVTAEPAPTAEPAAATGLADALAARWEADGLLEGLYRMDETDVLDLFGIDFSACKSGAAFGDAVGYTNEAAVMEADGAVLDEAEALLRDHLEAVKAQFKGYDPAALALAEKAVLVREGNAILFVISPHAEEMLSAFRDLTK